MHPPLIRGIFVFHALINECIYNQLTFVKTLFA